MTNSPFDMLKDYFWSVKDIKNKDLNVIVQHLIHLIERNS